MLNKYTDRSNNCANDTVTPLTGIISKQKQLNQNCQRGTKRTRWYWNFI